MNGATLVVVARKESLLSRCVISLVIERVFDPFYTTKAVSKRSVLGLRFRSFRASFAVPALMVS